MAGDRDSGAAPWERAARRGNDGDDWYGGRDGAADRRAAAEPAQPARYVYDDDDDYDDGIPEPRRGGSTGSGSTGSGAVRGGAGSRGATASKSGPSVAGPRSGGPSVGGTRGTKPGRRPGTGGTSGAKPRFGAKTIVLASTISLLLTVFGAGGFAYAHFSGSIQTFDTSGLDPNRPAAAKANAQGQIPLNILLVGSDSRSAENQVYGGGNDPGARSDTSILLHVYADHQHAVGISFPRDMLVDIPTCLYDPSKPDGRKTGPQHGMFNVAFSIGDTNKGNVACEINTIESMSGIRIDHTMVVGFAAFAHITDAIGGVPVCVPKDIPSTDGDNITLKKGIYPVSGQAALNYVRKRDGIGDGSDISRTRRQQAFLGSMVKKIESDGVLSDAQSLTGLLNAALKYVTFDPSLGTLGALSGFADSMKSLKPANVQFLTLPGHYNGDRVDFDPVAAGAIWDHLKNDQLLDGSELSGGSGTAATPAPAATAKTTAAPVAAAPSIPPSNISVRVLNGTAATGLAGNATSTLTAAGYNAVVSKVKPKSTSVTTIVYGSTKSDEAAANQLAALYPGAKTEPGGASSTLVLTLGSDYAAAHGGTATDGGSTGTATPETAGPPVSSAPLPADIAKNSRTADSNLCDGIQNGFGAGTG